MLDVLYLAATLENARPHLELPPQSVIEEIVFHRGFAGPSGLVVCPGNPGCPVDDIDDPTLGAGAAFPITGFAVGDLPGTEYYISPSGSGSTCSQASPCATIAAAQTAAPSGTNTIVARGGAYRDEGNSCTWSAGVCTYSTQTSITDANLTISAYPGETPIFRGTQDETSDFAAAVAASGQKCISYSPIPVTDGSGVNFATNGGNLNGGVESAGKFPDQVWVNGVAFQQVLLKSQVVAGKFWVDSTYPLGNTVSVSSTVNPTRVMGSGTQFTKGLIAGESITVGAVGNSLAAPTGTIQTRTILTVDTDTQLTVTSAFTTTVSGTRMRRNGNHVLCLVTADADGNGGTIEVSNKGNWLSISAANLTVQGITVEKYSNTMARFGVLIINNSGDNALFDNFALNNCGLVCVSVAGASTAALDDVTFRDMSMNDGNYVGMTTTYTSDLRYTRLLSTGNDPWDEYAPAPTSGVIKPTKTLRTVIEFSRISDNRENGVWFDQTNLETIICSNVMVNNGTVAGDNSLFVEINDGALICNNYLQAPVRAAAKIAGSSGVRLWNNTIVGGADGLGFYADSRSNLALDCANPNRAGGLPCTGHPTSDWWVANWHARPDTADWMPRLDEMFNNIVANPTGVGLCSPSQTPFCILSKNTSAPGSDSTINDIFHAADVGRGIPETTMDTNLYANGGTGIVIARKHDTSTNYNAPSGLASWQAFLDSLPIGATLDNNSIFDPTGSTYIEADGTPKAALDPCDATPVPTDAILNIYIPAGTTHYGATWLGAVCP